jgi:mechanosensitive ion channel-like protein
MLIAGIGESVQHGFSVFFGWIPALLGALAILLIGYIVARVVSGLVGRLAHRAGLDRALHGGPGGTYISRVTARPSRLLGTLAFWAIFLGAVSLAATALGIAALTAFIGAVWAYLPNVLVALVIFVAAGALAAGVATLATRVMGDTSLGKVVATAAPILIMTIATFMILDQLKIAHNIVVITYAALLGAIALGSALAFGLGGREVAARMLEGAYTGVQENKHQWKRDLDHGMARAKDEAGNLKEQTGDDGSQRVERPRVAHSIAGGGTATAPPARDDAFESAWDDTREPHDRPA